VVARKFVPRLHQHSTSLYLDGKNCAMHSLISASVNYLRHDKFHFVGFQSLSTKNDFYCRAVSTHYQLLTAFAPCKDKFVFIKFSAIYRDQSIAHEIKTSAPSLEKFAFYESTLLMYQDLAIAQLINSPPAVHIKHCFEFKFLYRIGTAHRSKNVC